MFETARLKLTAWYLLIIMVISLSFSGVIYAGINSELVRIERYQEARNQEREMISPLLEELRQERQALGLPPLPPFQQDYSIPDLSVVSEARARLISILGVINGVIFVAAGLAGYFLAGRTLAPIIRMVEEQKEFISNASHELRTPLTSLRSEIEVALRDKKMNLAEAKKLLASNLEEVDKMSRLANYLLELNKYQSGRIQPVVKPLDLKDVAIRAIETMTRAASARKILVVPELTAVQVKGDEESLVQLVAIFLDNAIKYSPRRSEIRVRVRGSRGHGTIEVKDEGVGIAKDDLPHIFDRFYRAELSRNKEKVDGYGLGLALAKSIAEVNGGKIKVRSKLGQGSTFSVQI